MTTQLTPLGTDIWTLAYPLRFLGMQLGRRVCIIRIPENRVVIHSTGPFNPEQVREIKALGRVAAMLDGTTMHDTFTAAARTAFPESLYLAPEGFSRKAAGNDARPLSEIVPLTNGHLQTVRLDGMRQLNEYACHHSASRTLILCDLLFNLDQATGWTRWCMRNLMGVAQWPAIDRPVRWAVKDRNAFLESLRAILAWDFDRIVVAHGSIIETDGRRIFEQAVRRAGFDL